MCQLLKCCVVMKCILYSMYIVTCSIHQSVQKSFLLRSDTESISVLEPMNLICFGEITVCSKNCHFVEQCCDNLQYL